MEDKCNTELFYRYGETVESLVNTLEERVYACEIEADGKTHLMRLTRPTRLGSLCGGPEILSPADVGLALGFSPASPEAPLCATCQARFEAFVDRTEDEIKELRVERRQMKRESDALGRRVAEWLRVIREETIFTVQDEQGEE